MKKQNYVFLQEGDVIQNGDQYIDDEGNWTYFSRMIGDNFVGGNIRRPVENQSDETDKGIKFIISLLGKNLEELSQKQITLQAKADSLGSTLDAIRCEIACRIEHGADSNGHLEGIWERIFKHQQEAK